MRRTCLLLVMLLAGGCDGCSGESRSEAAAPVEATERGGAPAEESVTPELADVLEGLATSGAAQPKVVVLVGVDYTGPAAQQSLDVLHSLIERFADQVLVGVLHNPENFRDRSRPVAAALLAAQRQGRYWEMAEAILEADTAPSDPQLQAIAQELRLDVGQFEVDRRTVVIDREIQRQQAILTAVGAFGSPSFLVNGRVIRGFQEADRLALVVSAELEQEASWEVRTAAQSPKGEAFVDWVAGGERPPEDAVAPPPPVRRQPGKKRVAQRPFDPTVWRVRVRPDDPRNGPISPHVTVVVFCHFDDPWCGKVLPELDRLVAANPDEVAAVFLTAGADHGEAVGRGIRAALAAHGQGKFWEMARALTDKRTARSLDEILEIAGGLELDMDLFREAMTSDLFDDAMRRDQELAESVKVHGVPTFFVNGRRLVGPRGLERVGELVAVELDKARNKVEGGADVRSLYTSIIKEGKTVDTLRDEPARFDVSRSPRLGPADAPHTLVAFTTFGDTFGSKLWKALEPIVEARGDLAAVFKHYPTPIHDGSRPAARAAIAALQQDKFWEMARALFEEDEPLDDDRLYALARDLGLDEDAFRQSFLNPVWDRFLDAELGEAKAAEVRGTPALFLDGYPVDTKEGLTREGIENVLSKKLDKKEE